MMIEQTRNKMAELHLHGMLKSFDLRLSEASSQGWGTADFLSALITDESAYRENAKVLKRLKTANFRTGATFEMVDYLAKRSLTKPLVKDLMLLNYVKSAPSNLIIIGPTGVGKTFLATAIGNHACRHGYTVHFQGLNVFMEKLIMSRADNTYLKLREKLIKFDMLIIDDIGLKKIPAIIAQDLHDILEERQSKCTIFTTQLPLKNWNEIIEDPLILDTIVDKLKHGTIECVVTGETYRKVKRQHEKIDKV